MTIEERAERIARLRQEIEARGCQSSAMVRWAGNEGLPKAQAYEPQEGQLAIYGPIVSGLMRRIMTVFEIEHTTAESVRERLGKIKGDVEVRINSPGGEVFEAASIVTFLTERQAAGDRVSAVVEGIAASAAFLVALSCKEIRIGQLAMMMVHRSSVVSVGDCDELRKSADLLEKIDSGQADLMEKRTGMKRAAIEEILKAETWWSAKEAVDAKIADKVIEQEDADDGEPEAIARAQELSICGLIM